MATPKWRTAPSPEHRSVSLFRRRVLGLGVILALVGGGCGHGGQLGAMVLLQQSKSLRSDSAEGALLAQDAVAGKTTRIYLREHAFDLYKAASQAEVALEMAQTDPALDSKLSQLTVLASQVRADLKRLGSAPTDEDLALARELEAAAQASLEIGKELG